MGNHRKLGELLIERNLISRQQLADAIRAQYAQGKPLGEILLERKLISARQLSRTLKWQSLLRAAMLISSVSFAASPCLASEAQRITQQLVDSAGGFTQTKGRNAKQQRLSSPEPDWLKNLRAGPAAPVVTLLSGRYAGGATPTMKGLRYKANWTDDSINLELRFQF